MRVPFALAILFSSAGLAAASCGGSTGTVSPGGDGGGSDATVPTDGSGSAEDGAPPPEDGSATDAGTACDPPSDSTKSAVCLVLHAETITFGAAPAFDGKGYLVAQLFDTADPDLSDGGTATPIATTVLPGADAGADAGLVDLAAAIPMIRFDGLPPSVFIRAVFADDPAPASGLRAGDWLAGYDLSAGLYKGVPLRNEALTPGQSQTVTLDLRALRRLSVDMSAATTPVGNAQGPAAFFAVDQPYIGAGSHVFGVGRSACASLADASTATVEGFVLGAGPYYVTGWLDDFGTWDGGGVLPPGDLVALEVGADGGPQIPAADQVTYAPTAYSVSKALPLGLVVAGDAGADGVTCP
jgi:hypothetical protein